MRVQTRTPLALATGAGCGSRQAARGPITGQRAGAALSGHAREPVVMAVHCNGCSEAPCRCGLRDARTCKPFGSVEQRPRRQRCLSNS
ncbi:conserved exported hypothetical protein [Xanthomonas citri pv. citri]|uniref:Uncharacterized protein n=1 Tax=Xanthomonas citri pv. citri TaxID=611301 RepID=A0A0U5GFX6_XANCI|nr:conserved exported hypothetical protein [Xanthomonas citri pv. citri]CEE16812.1 conserved exported hypothetical protein [Xanthomonas citri pv. citri]CEE17704.1 conserved exported hypothetical protein [Xanthomonas citri pv. citri]CEE22914.1 conserved exported hypothetical protein [Xanthomonas citri pv. citri]CEE23179.1 conserved exported hypothetical protein [Xanthomonas citri pv. citri]